ncbi:MAG: hypothetical protein IJ432_00040 [Clostridia bacterium]|nr:hypothetical protein [Clostridia bacterium]MEE1055048.1 hypothetical protein [Acutalibacteraceae bacterium]
MIGTESTVIVAIISFAGTLIGTAGGIIASGKLTEYRLSQLEKKVDSQNAAASRIPVLEEKINNINRRVGKIEKEQIASCGYFEGCQ